MHVKTMLATIAAFATILLSGPVAAAEPARPLAVSADTAIDSIIQQQMSEVGMVGIGAAIIVDKEVVEIRR